jgi:hypothetical protein
MVPSPVGHYVDADGAGSATPCARGKYQDVQGNTECKTCPAGKYCDREGLAAGVDCPAGYYCVSGLWSYHGGLCGPGTYCPTGSSVAKPCDAGKYCLGSGLAAATGPCMAGYYCKSAASVPNPIDGTTGDMCPKGSYCDEGASSATPCAAGTYSDRQGASSSSFCSACPDGLQCESAGQALPVHECPAGFHCTYSSSSVTGTVKNKCSKGHYCPALEAAELVCPPGQYQDEEGKAVCKVCPAGKKCGDLWTGAIATEDCPAGFFCPGSAAKHSTLPEYPFNTLNRYATAYPCPPGTLLSASGASTCPACPEKQHCNAPALGSTIQTTNLM